MCTSAVAYRDHGFWPYDADLCDWLALAVLELGCGTGQFTRILAQTAAQVISTDPLRDSK